MGRCHMEDRSIMTKAIFGKQNRMAGTAFSLLAIQANGSPWGTQ
jgi:hypothetical protein